jgi:hypothetical protein
MPGYYAGVTVLASQDAGVAHQPVVRDQREMERSTVHIRHGGGIGDGEGMTRTCMNMISLRCRLPG